MASLNFDPEWMKEPEPDDADLQRAESEGMVERNEITVQADDSKRLMEALGIPANSSEFTINFHWSGGNSVSYAADGEKRSRDLTDEETNRVLGMMGEFERREFGEGL